MTTNTENASLPSYTARFMDGPMANRETTVRNRVQHFLAITDALAPRGIRLYQVDRNITLGPGIYVPYWYVGNSISNIDIGELQAVVRSGGAY